MPEPRVPKSEAEAPQPGDATATSGSYRRRFLTFIFRLWPSRQALILCCLPLLGRCFLNKGPIPGIEAPLRSRCITAEEALILRAE